MNEEKMLSTTVGIPPAIVSTCTFSLIDSASCLSFAGKSAY